MLHHDGMRVDPAYADRLHECGLDSVEKVLARVEGEIAAWSRTTDTLYVPGRPERPGFYVKRYLYPTWRNRLRGAFRGTFFGQHRGEAEYRLLDEMRSMGIAAVRPVAYGARRVAHFLAACFLITEEAPDSCNLTTFARDVTRRREPLSHALRSELVRQLAREVAGAHGAGFEHGQMFWRNILVRFGPTGQPEYLFLDARPRRGRRRLGRSVSWWMQELAQLAASAMPFTTRTDRMRFVHEYYGARQLSHDVKEQIRVIDRLAQQYRRHESQRIRMNDLFNEWRQQLAEERRVAASQNAEGTRRDA